MSEPSGKTTSPTPNSDLDQQNYLELIKESSKTGKSIQQILAERKGLVWEDKSGQRMSDEVKKTLAENTFVVRPKQKEQEEQE